MKKWGGRGFLFNDDRKIQTIVRVIQVEQTKSYITIKIFYFLIYETMRSELNTDLLRDLNNVILLAL